MAARSPTPSSARKALMVPRTHEVIDRVDAACGSSTYMREPLEATWASRRNALALNARTSANRA